jgi:hypothetical protein
MPDIRGAMIAFRLGASLLSIAVRRVLAPSQKSPQLTEPHHLDSDQMPPWLRLWTENHEGYLSLHEVHLLKAASESSVWKNEKMSFKIPKGPMPATKWAWLCIFLQHFWRVGEWKRYHRDDNIWTRTKVCKRCGAFCQESEFALSGSPPPPKNWKPGTRWSFGDSYSKTGWSGL